MAFIRDPESLGNGAFKEDGYFFCICTGGTLSFSLVESSHCFEQGDALILKNHLNFFTLRSVSKDFSMDGIFASNAFLARTGVGKYASDPRRKTALFFNPVIRMGGEKFSAILQSIDQLRARTEARSSYHYEDSVVLAFHRLILDFSEGQIEGYLTQKAPDVNAQLFSRFIQLLEQGHARSHRCVSWYADQLCITPKHLSHCAKMAGGRPATYWIDSYCIRGVVDALGKRSASEVCKEFHFSSLSYMSRYVRRLTGFSPREIR